MFIYKENSDMNVKDLLVFSCFILIHSTGFTQAKDAYKIYTSDGASADYTAMAEKAGRADVIFFGELHDNPIAHWLQFELTKDLFVIHGEHLKIGAEMFEADNQLILNEYLLGLISESRFENEARLWPNYQTDYKPILEFAKANNLSFIATNIPRRYASVVASKGFDGLKELSKEALTYIAPLPVAYDLELEGYRSMMNMDHGMGDNENFPKAQAIKDATMAHFIANNMKKKDVMLHLNGAYHSQNFEGIVWYLTKENKRTSIITIHTVLQDDINELEEDYENSADFILVVPTSMTKTY